jgi:acetyl esterase
MPLDPRVRIINKIMVTLDRRSGRPMVDQRRSAAAIASRGWVLVMHRGPKPASTEDVLVPVDGGQIVVRLHRPHGPGPHPLHVFLHGGGWCIGTLTERDPRCRQIVAGADCAVASVDYRMAPENAFPTPVEDCYAALCWLVDHATELGFDATRVSIGGESAGGNLAAAVCLMARDRSGPAIVHQWLDVPAVDCTLSQPSMREVPDGHGLDYDTILEFRACYLPDEADYTHPYASPLLADDLSNLPPAWIASCEVDKLRDDGIAYAKALADAGVPVRHQVLAGHVHSSFAFTRLVPSARAYERDAIAALRSALHP